MQVIEGTFGFFEEKEAEESNNQASDPQNLEESTIGRLR
jgi:hypothetical protein